MDAKLGTKTYPKMHTKMDPQMDAQMGPKMGSEIDAETGTPNGPQNELENCSPNGVFDLGVVGRPPSRTYPLGHSACLIPTSARGAKAPSALSVITQKV